MAFSTSFHRQPNRILGAQVTSRMSLRSSTKSAPDRTKNQCKKWTLHLTISAIFASFFQRHQLQFKKKVKSAPPQSFWASSLFPFSDMPVMLPDVASLFESRSNGDTSALHLDSCHGPTFSRLQTALKSCPLCPDWRRQTNGAIWFLHNFNGRNGGNWLASSRHCHITLILMLCNLASAQSMANIKYSSTLVIVPQNHLTDQPQEMESLCSNV